MKLLLLLLVSYIVFNILKALKFVKTFTGNPAGRPVQQKKEKTYKNLDIRDAEFKDMDE